jgi:O-antigen ligase
MSTVRAISQALPERGEAVRGALIAAGVALLAYYGIGKFGVAGLLAPPAVVLVAIMLRRPVGMMAILCVITILFEGKDFGLLSFGVRLYAQAFKGMTPLDMLVAITLLASAFNVIATKRRVFIPRPLVPAVLTLLLGMISGIVIGSEHGQSLRTTALAEHVLAYMLFLPLVVSNLQIDRRQIMIFLGAMVALADLKALLGLAEVVGHYGPSIEGRSTLTYYEPTANWVIMMALLSICAALAGKVRLPRWMPLSAPLLLACLLLSYRRSFWIAAVLGLLIVILLGLSPLGRRLLLPTVVLVAVAMWMVGSVSVQSQSPIVKRAESLSPTKLEQSPEARYRNDERANVLAAISENPITGLGMKVPWAATAQTLSLENTEGREYVEVGALWFWLKLGILGLAAYVSFILGALLLSWRVWRRSPEGPMRAFGLASLAAFLGLLPIEVTASFTGVEARFTVVACIQVGLLALLAKSAAPGGLTAWEPAKLRIRRREPLAAGNWR